MGGRDEDEREKCIVEGKYNVWKKRNQTEFPIDSLPGFLKPSPTY
jgi:hypothetical protein